jgi:hypothetical protein
VLADVFDHARNGKHGLITGAGGNVAITILPGVRLILQRERFTAICGELRLRRDQKRQRREGRQ